MMRLHKFRSKKHLLALMAIALLCVVTWRGEARHASALNIYSTLTTDTVKPRQKDSVTALVKDTISKPDTTLKRTDTIQPSQKIDTFQ